MCELEQQIELAQTKGDCALLINSQIELQILTVYSNALKYAELDKTFLTRNKVLVDVRQSLIDELPLDIKLRVTCLTKQVCPN